ncbi:MAG: hypothetical protein LBT83_05365 [Tannerella sp.]|jgi:hypothetical protein|nr:hypothetical protein [Tannerella sp.]
MKRIFNVLVVFFILGQTACNGQLNRVESRIIRPDSTVLNVWGNTVCNIIFSPAKVCVYTLNPMATAGKETETVGGFVIDKKLGNIAKNEYVILQFLLQDSLNYRSDDGSRNKCPFAPYLAFEFTRKKEKAVLLLAFNCEAWRIVYNDTLHETEYNCGNQLVRFAQGLLPEDLYLNVLTNK